MEMSALIKQKVEEGTNEHLCHEQTNNLISMIPNIFQHFVLRSLVNQLTQLR